LEVRLNAGLQHNTVKDLVVAGSPRNVQAAYAPEQTASASLKYTLPSSVFDRGKLSFQVDGNYQSSVWDNPDNFTADRLPGYSLGNVRVFWVDPSGKLQVEGYMDNVTNKVYKTVGFDLSEICGCNLAAYGKPRWAGVTAKYHF
jgi:iron complex outermembrane receptor protein